MIAWHFLKDDYTLRDGSPAPDVGETLEYNGQLDASERIIDALSYALGEIVCRVHCAGRVIHGGDELVTQKRTIEAMADASSVLHLFACDEAEAALRRHGGENIRSLDAIATKRLWIQGLASDRELAAARAEAKEAAGAAAREAVRAAKWAATRTSEASTAWAAAWAAARMARLAAAKAAEASAVMAAKWAAAGAAAAAAAALAGAGEAAREAMRAAEVERQNRILTMRISELLKAG